MVTIITVFLNSTSQTMLGDLLTKEKKRVLKKYKDKIEKDWYDYQDDQIEGVLRQHDSYFNSLCIAESQLFPR